ncbi:MAG: hypothetical protein J5702_06560, partial [Bacteroidales bacterium]|nr:hypothetical protein [Bacteroidales bacterium]
PACHAGGREFESRPHRIKKATISMVAFFIYALWGSPSTSATANSPFFPQKLRGGASPQYSAEAGLFVSDVP